MHRKRPQSALLFPTHLPHPSQATPVTREWFPITLSEHWVAPQGAPLM
jgi:hypothetical protein